MDHKCVDLELEFINSKVAIARKLGRVPAGHAGDPNSSFNISTLSSDD